MSGSRKSEQEHVPHFLHKKVKTRKFFGRFTLQSCKSTAGKCTRKCAAIRPIVVFHSSGQGHPTFDNAGVISFKLHFTAILFHLSGLRLFPLNLVCLFFFSFTNLVYFFCHIDIYIIFHS